MVNWCIVLWTLFASRKNCSGFWTLEKVKEDEEMRMIRGHLFSSKRSWEKILEIPMQCQEDFQITKYSHVMSLWSLLKLDEVKCLALIIKLRFVWVDSILAHLIHNYDGDLLGIECLDTKWWFAKPISRLRKKEIRVVLTM